MRKGCRLLQGGEKRGPREKMPEERESKRESREWESARTIKWVLKVKTGGGENFAVPKKGRKEERGAKGGKVREKKKNKRLYLVREKFVLSKKRKGKIG